MINVLIVDDDPMVAELNRRYLEQIPGYCWCGSVSNLQSAQEKLADSTLQIDLVLLDIYLQQENGLDLLPEIRKLKNTVDVIVISSASDMVAIKKALSYGVVDYLIKPFQFARFTEALAKYREDHQYLSSKSVMNQGELDALIRHSATPPTTDLTKLPKGLTRLTLQSVWQWITTSPQQQFSTEEMAAAIGISRVSCRKYLLYLSELGVLSVDIFYGTVGRPVYLYKLDLSQSSLMDAVLK